MVALGNKKHYSISMTVCKFIASWNEMISISIHVPINFNLGYPGVIPHTTSHYIDAASGITPGYPRLHKFTHRYNFIKFILKQKRCLHIFLFYDDENKHDVIE